MEQVMEKKGSNYRIFDLNDGDKQDDQQRHFGMRLWIEEPKYHENDKVFALEKDVVYAAIILTTTLKTAPINDINDTSLSSNHDYWWEYYVHFKGYNARHNRWLKDDEIIPYDEEWKMMAEESKLKLVKAANATHKKKKRKTQCSPVQTASNKKRKNMKSNEKIVNPTFTDIAGPISTKVSRSIQRSWLEDDSPSVPTATSSYFVPQVGDIILYYPTAHYNFLKEHSNIRKEIKYFHRKPLWEQHPSQKHASTKNTDSCWERWIQGVELGEASYPLLCRVQMTTAEFPPDTTTKRSKNINLSQQIQHVYLNVLLKPLTPLHPPRVSSNYDDSFFHEDDNTIPSSFSVITFPSNQPQFIVPFVWAYSMSISISIGDHVRTTSAESTYQVIGKDTYNTSIDVLELFRQIIRSDVCADIDCTSKTHKFIENCYLDSKSKISLPEDCLRIVLQDIIMICRSKFLNEESSADSSQMASPIQTKKSLSNIFKWIQMTLPRWGGVKLISGNNQEEKYMSAWNLIPIDLQGKDKINDIIQSQRSNLQLLSSSHCIGGLIYSLSESPRANIESFIKKFISESSQIVGVSNFMEDVSEILVPAYKCYDPILMSLNRVLRRLELQKLNLQMSSMSSKSYYTLENVKCCYYRSTDAIFSDLLAIFSNCVSYNNDPESDIVKKLFDLTSQLLPLITNMKEQEQNKWKWKLESKLKELHDIEQLSLRKAETPKKLIPGFNWTLLLNSCFESELSREWISSMVMSTQDQHNHMICYLMDVIEIILQKRKLKRQYRDKNEKHIFNLAWSFLVGHNIQALNAHGFNTPHNFKIGKGICTTPVEEQKIPLYRKRLYRLCKEIIELIDPKFAKGEFIVNFSCMNSQTHYCKKHIDKDDISYQYALALGDYVNASLRLYGENDKIIGNYNYRRKILKLDGRLPHELISEGFSGTRFCIIWFKTTDQSKMKADELFKTPHYVFGGDES